MPNFEKKKNIITTDKIGVSSRKLFLCSEQHTVCLPVCRSLSTDCAELKSSSSWKHLLKSIVVVLFEGGDVAPFFVCLSVYLFVDVFMYLPVSSALEIAGPDYCRPVRKPVLLVVRLVPSRRHPPSARTEILGRSGIGKGIVSFKEDKVGLLVCAAYAIGSRLRDSHD